MCRLLAYRTKSPERNLPVLLGALAAFGNLAATGRVPKGIPAGHRDGWGIAAFRGGSPVVYARSAKPADEDALYGQTVRALEAAAPDTVIAHLRKASAGSLDAANAQPFLADGLAFAHNGSIGARGSCDGPSDSLRFFRAAIGRGGDPFAATEALVAEARAGEYRAMNFLLTDGSKVRAWRDWNEATDGAEALGLAGYYGLFCATREDVDLVSSEPLPIDGFTFEEIPNGTSVDLA